MTEEEKAMVQFVRARTWEIRARAVATIIPLVILAICVSGCFVTMVAGTAR